MHSVLFKIIMFLSLTPQQVTDLEQIALKNNTTVEEIIASVVQDRIDTDICIAVQRLEDEYGQ